MEDNRNRDLVLSPNEYAYVLDSTKGIVSSIVGSYKLSLSNSDKLVDFNEDTKRFEECGSSEAIHTFVSAPEGWYISLKNPTKNNEHPRVGTSNMLPPLEVGRKINIEGPESFALYPGQMARVIKGHSLKSNQYLLVRVYDDVEINDHQYTTGDHLIIKGTEESFFIPVTGLEVVPDAYGNYTRNAVTLHDLEYSILVSESGKRRYVHGPMVVFPEVDEKFVINTETNNEVFKAIELSDISGIYVKVIADYCDTEGEKSISHKAGEELFITGKDQRIYYPRTEHAIIDYDGKILHHAIAIPTGEGRYVLNRLTGDVKMIKGPKMYLPDPRFEVIVKRKLSKKECELWYPGNNKVLEYNTHELSNTVSPIGTLVGNITMPQSCSSDTYTISTSNMATLDALDNGFLAQEHTPTYTKAGLSRGNTYSKPRTITIDNKYDGVVTIDVWTGYAINVISKDGKRKVIVGPQTYLLAYDETLETVYDDSHEETVFLKVDNNKFSDKIRVQTNDFVDIDIILSYCVSFEDAVNDEWFSDKDYITHILDYERAAIKAEVKNHSLEEFYHNASDIIKKVVVKKNKSGEDVAVATFTNGAMVSDVEVFSVAISNNLFKTEFDQHQAQIIRKSLELSSGLKELETTKELERVHGEMLDLELQRALHEINVKNQTEAEKLTKEREITAQREAMEKASKEAENDLQKLMDSIHKAELARQKADDDQLLSYTKEQDKLVIDKQKAFTDSIKKVIDSISPDLIAAMTTSSKADMLKSVVESLAPYALAGDKESVADVVDKLTRGTAMQGLLDVTVTEEKNIK